jgi:hypothetical protein
LGFAKGECLEYLVSSVGKKCNKHLEDLMKMIFV